MSTAERIATVSLSGRINQGVVVLAASIVLLVAAGLFSSSLMNFSVFIQ